MPKDKQLHLLCGFVLGLVGSQFGVPLAMIAGAAKELYDYFNQDKHSVEFADFAYTVTGGAVAEVLLYCYILVVR